MARILIVSNKYPFPIDDGKKAVLAGFLEYLIERHGKSNVVYIVIGKSAGSDLRKASCETIWIAPPGPISQTWSLAAGWLGRDRKSIQELITYSSRIKRTLKQCMECYRPELILLDTIRVGQYFWNHGSASGRRILYMDDLYHLRFERLLQMSKLNGVGTIKAAGTFTNTLPGFVRKLLDNRTVRNLLYRTEINRVKRRELQCPENFDQCLLINPNETDLLRSLSRSQSIFAVKPFVTEEGPSTPRTFDGSPVFLMFGSLNHPVYRASVIQFLERGMPHIRRELPQARIEIIGGGPDDQIRLLSEQYEGHVALRGFVESIDDIFASACAMLVPLISAGGLKLKAVTALCYGLPMVATDSAIDGIPLVDGQHYLLENDVTRYYIHMARLTEPSYNRQMSDQARQAYCMHYSGDAIRAEYDSLMGLGAS
jgi:glycosyltransferase involved in cell wall biosynthesis